MTPAEKVEREQETQALKEASKDKFFDWVNDKITLSPGSGDEWTGAASPHSKSGKSFNFNKAKGTYNNWAGEEQGDVFTWIADECNLDIKNDFPQIRQIIADRINYELKYKYNPDRQNTNSDSDPIQSCLSVSFGYFRSNLTPERRIEINDTWGLSDETINKYNIGYAPAGDGAELQRALKEYYTQDELKQAGLVNQWGYDHYKGRIIFPYMQDGKYFYSIGRRTDSTPLKKIRDKTTGKYEQVEPDKYIKHLAHKNENIVHPSILNGIYGVDSIRGADYCIITEGITDTLAALQAGYPCLSPVTTRFSEHDKESLCKLTKNLNTVYICNDTEISGAGQKGALKTAFYLMNQGINVKIISLPMRDGSDKIDLAEYLRDNPKELFDILIAEAKTPVFPSSITALNYFEGDKFIAKMLGDEILNSNHIMTLQDTKEVLLYQNGVYVRETGEDIVKNIILDKLDTEYKKQWIAEVLEYIKLKTLTDRSELYQHHFIINVKNGMYDVFNDKLLPHDPKYKSVIQVNVIYNPAARCPEIHKFLTEIAHLHNVPLLVQYNGYCFTSDIQQQKALLIEGHRNNGKTKFIEMLSHIMGTKNISVQSLQDLCNDRFSRVQLKDKLFNQFSDLPAGIIKDTSGFKRVVTDLYLDGEQKYGVKHLFQNTAKHIYSANRAPELEDDNEDAYFRRFLMITFPNTFEGDKADRNILDKLTTQEEVSGLFNIAMIGLRALLKHNEFVYFQSEDDVKYLYQMKSDPLNAFITTNLEESATNLSKDLLYTAYDCWCETNGVRKESKTRLTQALHKHGYSDFRSSEGNRPYLWGNVQVVQVLSNFKTASWTASNKAADDYSDSIRPSCLTLFDTVELYSNMYALYYSTYAQKTQMTQMRVFPTEGTCEPKNLDNLDSSQKPPPPYPAEEKIPEKKLDETWTDHPNNLDGFKNQHDRLTIIKQDIKTFEKIYGQIDRFKIFDFIPYFMKKHPEFDKQLTWSDVCHELNMPLPEYVVLEVKQDIKEYLSPAGRTLSATVGDIINLDRTGAKALIKQNLAVEVGAA